MRCTVLMPKKVLYALNTQLHAETLLYRTHWCLEGALNFLGSYALGLATADLLSDIIYIIGDNLN